MDKKKVGGAIIGFGGMGHFHYRKMMENPDIEFIGVYDIDPEVSKKAEEDGIFAFSTREELLADERIDLITIATPNDFHKEIAIASMAAGKNVISEKPVTLSCEDLEEMIAASEKYGKLFTVHQNRRWDDDYVMMKKLFDENTLGKVYKIESRVQGSRGIPSGWRREKAHGGGMIYDWGVHLFDQMLMMMGDSEIVSVYAQISQVTNVECDDGFTATIVFDNGVRWTVEVETNNFIELPLWYMLGENGSAVIHNWECDGEMVLIHNWDKMDAVPYQAGTGITKTMAPRTPETIKKFPLEKIHTDRMEYYNNIVKTIRGEDTQLITHNQQRRLMKLIESVFKSVETNEVVKY